jgi:hypothetical protein
MIKYEKKHSVRDKASIRTRLRCGKKVGVLDWEFKITLSNILGTPVKKYSMCKKGNVRRDMETSRKNLKKKTKTL